MKKLAAILMLVLIASFPMESLAVENVLDISTKHTFQHEDTLIRYRMILPADYSTEKTYPLMLYLHGEEDAANNNVTQLRSCVQHIANVMTDTIIIVPQSGEGNQWVDVPVGQETYSIDEVPESNELAAIMLLLSDLQKEYSVDTDRMYLCGASMGAYGVWDLMARHPETFAAGIAIAGVGDISQAETFKNIPMFVFHGRQDAVVPVSAVQNFVQSIIDAGGEQIRYFESETAGHQVANSAITKYDVLETLTTYRLSDRLTKQGLEEEESIEKNDSSSEKGVEVVQDAGIVRAPSQTVLIIYVSVIVVIVGIPVIFIARKKRR